MNPTAKNNPSTNTSSFSPLSDSVAGESCLLPKGKRIAFIQAGWHREIVEQSQFAFISTLSSHGIDPSFVDIYDVPGSLEIPLQCKLLANSGNYSVIVAAGLIVDGGIYRHDFVAATVLDAMMNVQLESLLPILSLVLTPHHFSEAEAHQDFFFNHFKHKGEEAGLACIQTLNNMSRLAKVA